MKNYQLKIKKGGAPLLVCLIFTFCIFNFAFAQTVLTADGLASYGTNAATGGGGGYTYFLSESFETPTTGYENAGWSTFGGSPNPVYSTSGLSLQGAQCLHLNNASVIYDSFDKSTIYGYLQIRILNNNASVGDRSFFIGYNSVPRFEVGINSSRQLFLLHGNGGTSANTTATLSDSTTYNVWFEYHVGSGSDGVAKACFSTTTTKPISGTAFCSTTAGIGVENLHEAALYSDGSAVHMDCAIDKFRLSDSNIGDAPN